MSETQETLPAVVERSQVAVSRRDPFAWMYPTTPEEAMMMAHTLAKSTAVPDCYQGRPENVFVAMMLGQKHDMNAAEACQSMAVINATPSFHSDGFLAVIRASGQLLHFEEWFIDEQGNRLGDGARPEDIWGAVCHMKRVRMVQGEKVIDDIKRRYTIPDAITAGLWKKKKNWNENPTRMLQMRARAFTGRDTFADVLRGVGLVEEAMDTPTQVEIEDLPEPRDARDKVVDRAKEVQQPVKEDPKTEEPEQEETEPETTPEQEYIAKIIEQIAAIGIQPERDKKLFLDYATQAVGTKVTKLSKLSLTNLAQLWAVNDAILDEAGDNKGAALTAVTEIADTMKPIQDPNEVREIVKAILSNAAPDDGQAELEM